MIDLSKVLPPNITTPVISFTIWILGKYISIADIRWWYLPRRRKKKKEGGAMYRCIQQQHENPNSTEKSPFFHGPDSIDMTHAGPVWLWVCLVSWAPGNLISQHIFGQGFWDKDTRSHCSGTSVWHDSETGCICGAQGDYETMTPMCVWTDSTVDSSKDVLFPACTWGELPRVGPTCFSACHSDPH